MNQDLKQSMFEYYRERVPEYDEVYQGKGPASVSKPDAYSSEVVILYDIIKHTLSGDLIDIACGTAFWLPSYARAIRHVTLLDQSPEMLNAARARAESAGVLDCSTLLRGDIFHLDLDHGPFDCALIGFLISHFTSQQETQFFQTLRSVLNPNGRFLILDSVWTEARAKVREKEGPQERSLNDGRRFQIYKKYFDEKDLVLMQDKHRIDLLTGHFGKAFFASQGTFRNV